MTEHSISTTLASGLHNKTATIDLLWVIEAAVTAAGLAFGARIRLVPC